MSILFWLCLLFFIVISWRHGKIAHEAAIKACRLACQDAQVQLLDQTVAFKRFAIKRGALHRIYTFDYSPDGKERFRGIIWMRGAAVDYLAFDASNSAIVVAPSAITPSSSEPR